MKTPMKFFLMMSAAVLLAGCNMSWHEKNEPTTDAERKAVAEHAARLLAVTPSTLAGHDQDWDDAITEAHRQAKKTICRTTFWEWEGGVGYTGRWKYAEEIRSANPRVEVETRGTYEDGFNAALDSIAMLNIELSLKGERKTFGEMNEILRERHKISKPTPTTP